MSSDINLDDLAEFMVDVLRGKCHISDELIHAQSDPSMAELLMGVKILNEDLAARDQEVAKAHLEALEVTKAAAQESARIRSLEAELQKSAEIEELNQELGRANQELKDTQLNLVQAAKLSALGELGAGIAHELNQPLTVISGILELCLDDEKSLDPALARKMFLMHGEAERMATIINNVKTFARETSDQRAPMRLDTSVKRAVGLLQEQLKLNDIWFEEGEYDASLMIEGDVLVLQQVLLNLLTNSKDALLERAGGPKKRIRISLYSRHEHVVLVVEDNGPGIPEHVRGRIFEPFFTTKGVGSGTGLGLSITHGIVNKLGGEISLIEGSMGGAAFKLDFLKYSGPLNEEPESQVHSTPAELPVEDELELHVLLVDDDPVVRAVVQAILEKMGCRVTPFGSGLEAHQFLRINAVDLIVTDFMMPEFSGADLIMAIRAEENYTPAVVMTGARTERLVNLAHEAGAAACIEKPINRAKFREILRQVQLVHTNRAVG